MRKAIYASLALAWLATGAFPSAWAQDLFTIRASVSGAATGSQGFATFDEALEALSDQGLKRIVGGYDGTQSAALLFDYRGLEVDYRYPVAHGSLLTLQIPSLGINESFDGGTRDASKQLANDFLKKGDYLGQIARRLAAVSASDPVAGNPYSLMGRQVAGDYEVGFLQAASRIGSGGGGATRSLAGMGLRFGSYSQGNVDSKVVTLPLSYSTALGTPDHLLTVSLPITMADTQGARSYSGALSAAYRFPMNPNWALTVGASYGATYAADLGSVGQVASTSLTSTYVWRLGGFDIALGNMIGIYRTLKFSANGFSYDPGIRNTVLRNGILLSQPADWLANNLYIEYSLINTRYSGTELYSRGYNEIGVTVGNNKAGKNQHAYLRGGISYTRSRGSSGISMNVGYWF